MTPEGEVADRFAQWITGLSPGTRFFVWLHLAGLPVLSKTEESLEDSTKAYGERLAATDQALAKILDTLQAAGRLPDTAVVLVGTHGFLLGEDGARGSSYWLRPETLRVALVVKGAAGADSFPPGTRSSARVWLPDVAATLAALGSVTLPAGREGIDLVLAERETGSRIRRAWTWAPDDELAWPTLTAVDDGTGWRSFGSDELAASPSSEGSRALELARSRPATPRPRELPGDLKERMEAEGLVVGWQEEPEPQPEPVARTELLTKLQMARRQFRSDGNILGGRTRSRQLLRTRPDNLALIETMFYVQQQIGAKGRARDLVERAIKRYPLRPGLLHWGGHAFQLAGESAKGELLLEAALAIRGRDPELLYDLACAHALRGDIGGAVERLGQAIDAGFTHWRHIEQDRDLVAVRGDPRYAALLASHGR
jgi:hypothetical protein